MTMEQIEELLSLSPQMDLDYVRAIISIVRKYSSFDDYLADDESEMRQ